MRTRSVILAITEQRIPPWILFVSAAVVLAGVAVVATVLAARRRR
ncbi:hypothetical protein [Streptomyces sp. NPDC047841]